MINSGDLFESGSIEASGGYGRVTRTIEQIAKLAGLAWALNQKERGG